MSNDRQAPRTAFAILAAISFCHLLNDMLQSLLPAIYPLLKSSFGLDFGQIGLLTLTYQLTASLLQPVVGHYTDQRPQPYSLAALLGILVLWNVGRWYRQRHRPESPALRPARGDTRGLSPTQVRIALGVLLALIFSKYFYLASLVSYYTFYLISQFHLSVQSAQIHLFAFLGAVAAGTIIGGPIGDRFGRKYVIWGSILGVLPFTLALPYANLFWTGVLSVLIGLILASAFSAILVYAQELVPGRVGMISGLFFGFAFGMAGVGAAVLGELADHTDIHFVYQVCSFLPAMGLLAAFLPNLEPAGRPGARVVLEESAG